MKGIKNTLPKFVKALRQNLPIVCNAKGQWQVENLVMQGIRSVFKLDDSRLLSIAHALLDLYKNIEKIPVKKNADQEFFASALMEASDLLARNLEETKSDELCLKKNQIIRHRIALAYRLEGANGGWTKRETGDGALFDSVIREALAWKHKQANVIHKDLLPLELEILRDACRYSEFISFLLTDKGLVESFFQWTLQDHNAAPPFIEFPFMHAKIIECALNGRISRFGGTSLQIQWVDGHKVLTLPIEGRSVNILDDTMQVSFQGGYNLTIREIFDVFKNKMYRVGNLEFMADGIINWNVHHLGPWDMKQKRYQQINLGRADWWNQLPKLETLPLSKAQEKYGPEMNGKNWCVSACATRGSPTLDFDKTHAFLEIAIPDGKGGYGIYNFGKFAFVFPSSFFENFMTFCHNVHATIAYPDENIFYTHRQSGMHPFIISEEQGRGVMEEIKEDMQKSRERNFVFQIETENCAKWSYEKITSVVNKSAVPNLFKMPLLKTEPVGFCSWLFKTVNKLPEAIRVPVITRLHLIGGAAKKIRVIENGKSVMKSLNAHEFWDSGEVYLPAFMLQQKQSGVLSRYVEKNLR